MKSDHYCYLLDVPVENIGKMADFIYNKARDAVIAIDTDIIPYTSATQLRNTSEGTINALSDFNSRIASAIRDFSEIRVLITPDVKKEMIKSCGAACSEIGKVTQHPTLDKLAESYIKIVEERIGPRSTEYPSTNGIYDALIAIVRHLNLYFDLKKEMPGSSESDEKMIAYAFAQGVLQDKKVCIFSNNKKHVIPLARELYAVLTAGNIVGDDAKIKGRLINNLIEINCFDSVRNLYSSYDCRNSRIPGSDWAPPSQLAQEKIDELILFIRKNLLPVEKALGNGKVLEALIAGKGNDVLPHIPEASEAEAEETAKDNTTGLEDTVEAEAEKVPDGAFERIYQRMRVNVDAWWALCGPIDPKEHNDAVQKYEDLIFIYRQAGAPTSKLEHELEQIKEMGVMRQRDKLTKDTETIVAKRNEITKDTDYFKSVEKRKEVADLTAQIDENAGKLDGLEQSLKAVQSVNAISSLGDSEKKLYDSFKAAGLELTEEGVIVNSEQMTEITERTKASLYPVLSKMEEEVGLERHSEKRPAEYRIALKHLPYLVKKK